MATLRHRDRLATGGTAAIAAVAAEDKLHAPYLAALWAGLSGTTPSPLLDAVREKWRSATTDPAPVLAAIKATQDPLFRSNYAKNAVIAVGNGFPAWTELRRVVGREVVEGVAREPEFRLISRQVDAESPWSAPSQPGVGCHVIWDRLRLEGGDGPPLIIADHDELRAAFEQASGLRFGQHPDGKTVPKSALVTPAGSEVLVSLKKLPQPLLESLTLRRATRRRP
jgi:hypothetical protein